jgi:hypothetical protein
MSSKRMSHSRCDSYSLCAHFPCTSLHAIANKLLVVGIFFVQNDYGVASEDRSVRGPVDGHSWL